MPQNAHLESITTDTHELREPPKVPANLQLLGEKAEQLASRLNWLPSVTTSRTFVKRCRQLRTAFQPIFARLDSRLPKTRVSDDFRWLHDNSRLLYAEVQGTSTALKSRQKLPHVRTPGGEIVPRVLALAEGLLDAVSYQFSEEEFTVFVEAFQRHAVLDFSEIRTVVTALKLVCLEQIAARSRALLKDPSSDSCGVGTCVRSIRTMGETVWKDVLEPLIGFDPILRQDPAGAYPQMDFESRDFYRNKLSRIAAHSDCTELEVAREALDLAKEAQKQKFAEPRERERKSHVGYYLVDEGVGLLQQRVGFRSPWGAKIQRFVRQHPDEFFLSGIEILTFVILLTVIFLLDDSFRTPGLLLLSALIWLLPSSQSAVQIVNYLTTLLLPAEILPKLDFSEEIPNKCAAMVAVPSLLLNEKQVRGLVQDLEVRFLGNHDPNIHFALLTDLPDTHEPAREDSPLVDLCGNLIRELNEKYASQGAGSFFFFHRHRVYNPRERSWMGWERKRGKLLDLNKLLRGQFDSFPVKVGNLSVLPQIRFVITLDSDTELPRGTAHRLVGAMAHPLNQAIIDPEKNIVVAGYGILQPRVGVSVQSTARSRLAAIYAGETGFDIYTKAVSDAYQDLYREGIFTGKGIYEVDTVIRVLDRRFPRNALLSHDLIEGAYARAGLASDIEIIEDYPSHYSAYNRRKHRWLRGDWQITTWLFPRVPSESGARVGNPISLISRWKIFDNLRRSLLEPATFFLFVLGWLVLGRIPWHWTVAAIGVLFLPACFQLVVDVARALSVRKLMGAREALSGFFAAGVNLFFTLTFLAHQTLLSLDAVIRAIIRRTITRRRLLEWETAAEAELGQKRTPVDVYLNWMPLLALGLTLLVAAIRPSALSAALPILLLWGGSKLVSEWLNRGPVEPRTRASVKDVAFLRKSALHTWRYFAEFSTAEHNWLIPDNVQQQPPAIAARISPTNIGLLLNARQVACEFGYLGVPEFAEQTLRSLSSISGLRKYGGHLLNWYDTHTLEPLAPFFVSSVDSGNLLASLWTLQQGCLDRLHRPILQSSLAEGILDNLRVLVAVRAFPRGQLSRFARRIRTDNWLRAILDLPEALFQRAESVVSRSERCGQAKWFLQETRLRLQAIERTIRDYTPWHLPEFRELRDDPAINLKLLDSIALEQLPEFIDRLDAQLDSLPSTQPRGSEGASAAARLRELLPAARTNTSRLIAELQAIAAQSGDLADAMDFSFLLNSRRKLVSVGFDVESQQLQPACYDLLATESRTAIFLSIAKEDIPQESWFLLGRAHTLEKGRPVLLSWTGTMFEYLMPALWMRSYSNTLLDRSRVAAVRAQQAYATHKGVPWGISESAFFKLDESGNYQYHAFGLPQLALHKTEIQGLVISPYSSFLALDIDPPQVLRNLKRMCEMGWFGSHGFYEAADYSSPRRFWQERYRLVHCWMAHHQGMSLLAMANFLLGNVVQRWFHSDPRVQTTELLLHEKPVLHVRRADMPRRVAAA